MILDVLYIIIGVILVLVGADRLTEGASSLARRFGVPEIVIGLTIVACGTSMPEFFVSLMSALNDTPDMAVGNVVGSNIMNSMLIVGCAAVAAPLVISRSTVKKDIPFAVGASLLLILLSLDSTVGRIDGIILLVGFVGFMAYTLWQAKGSKAESADAVKQQNMLLDKRNKELNEMNQTQEKELLDAKKGKQKIETEHKKLLDSTGKMLMEIELLRNKVLELQENTINKMNNYNELIESAKQKQMAADMYFQEKQEQFKEINKDSKNLNEMFGASEEVKIPNKLRFRQKLHNKVITSINFNNFGSSFITTGADYIVRVYDAAKTIETNVFSGFSSSVTEACFDHTEQLLFAGSLDKSAKLWSLKNNKLLNTFTGHIDYINCVKSLNAQQHGLTGSSDRTIREWDYNTKSMVRKFNCISACHSLAIAPDDSYILSGHMDGTVKLWASNDKPEKVFDLHEDKVLQIKMIKNDQILTLGKDETIKLFDLRKEQPIYTINSSKIPQYCESSIGVSPDKKYFAVGSTKGTIYVVNLNEGSVDSTINNKGGGGVAISGLCWRPFNSQIYVGDSSGYLTIWGTSMGVK
jgi:Ca2+/Na+ antiporter